MSRKEFEKYLVDRGYRYFPPTRLNQYHSYAKRIPSELLTHTCLTNDRNSWVVHLWEPIEGHEEWGESYEFTIKGNANEIWYDLKAYSLSRAYMEENMDFLEKQFIDLWNALNPNK